ncbi:abortive infection family protein [Anabaena cylindrica UHCC 0172]|uniref:abortive infection family protein n=1 Tax=Anabaena cylindrica TaxID=1165 RepID=UPI002B218569|nr:abortive infection family protein [Anabaena cylindrica]MEA5551979.1 abortive infection family protein [Anabaena cylindrica UHCC 0172]
MNNSVNELLQQVERLKEILVSRATGNFDDGDNEEYKKLRLNLLQIPRINNQMPECVKKCRDLKEFWDFVASHLGKGYSGAYQERRMYLQKEFNPLLTLLETEVIISINSGISEILTMVDSEHIKEAWQKALERKSTDIDGAITIARTLLETVCKYILDKSGVTYDPGEDLPSLYRKTSKELTLAPSQHTEETLKRIFGGCQTIVEGLGTLRNRLSDAHGRSMNDAKPAPRHAELAVNMAGSMAIFLIQTWEENKF